MDTAQEHQLYATTSDNSNSNNEHNERLSVDTLITTRDTNWKQWLVQIEVSKV